MLISNNTLRPKKKKWYMVLVLKAVFDQSVKVICNLLLADSVVLSFLQFSSQRVEHVPCSINV